VAVIITLLAIPTLQFVLIRIGIILAQKKLSTKYILFLLGVESKYKKQNLRFLIFEIFIALPRLHFFFTIIAMKK